jgi:Cysteine rich repeat
MLVVRQQLAQKDYKVNLRVAKTCQEAINRYHCLDDMARVASFKSAQMSAILLCLEAAVKDGRYYYTWSDVDVAERRGNSYCKP